MPGRCPGHHLRIARTALLCAGRYTFAVVFFDIFTRVVVDLEIRVGCGCYLTTLPPGWRSVLESKSLRNKYRAVPLIDINH